MYYLSDLGNKVLINQILPDKHFKQKGKNKRISYPKSKLIFILIYYIVVYNGGIWCAMGSSFFKFLTTLKLLKNH